MALDPDDLRGHAGRRVLVRRARATRTARARSRSARWSPSRRCRRGCFVPDRHRCSRSASTCRPRSRCSTGSSSTSTCRSTSRRRRTPSSWPSARRRLVRARLVPLRRRRLDARGRRRHGAGRDDARRSSARPARARRRSATSSRGSTTSTRGAVTIDGIDVRDLTFDVARRGASASSRRRRTSSTRPCARTCASPSPTRPTRRSRRRRAAAQIHDADRVAPGGLRHRRRRARLPLLGRREAADRDRADDPPQPADPRPRRGDERRSTRRPSARCRRRSTGWPRAGRRSRSRTGSRPSATPTRSSSSTAAGSSSAARHEELLELGGRYAALVARDSEVAPLGAV